MPIPARRKQAYRKLAAAFNLIARRLRLSTCDRDAGLDEIKNLRRRLLRKLHPDKGGSGAADWNEAQRIWDEFLQWEKDEAAADVGSKHFRMHGRGFLVTYNSPTYQSMDPIDLLDKKTLFSVP